MSLALLDRDNPFQRVVAWNNLAKKAGRGDLENAAAEVAAVSSHS